MGIVRVNTKSEAQMFNGNHVIENRAAYSQLQYKKNGWIAQIGLRYEHYNLDGNIASKPVYRAGINKQLGRATFIRASYGEGFRYPSIAEMFTTTSTGSIFILPNADLKPETGNNLEIGVKQGISLGNKKVGIFNTYIDLSIFQNKYQNMMEYSFGSWFVGDFGSFKSVNMGSTTIQGFEIESAGAFEKSTQIKNTDGSYKTYKIQWLLGYTYAIPTIDDINYVFGKHSNSDPMTFKNTASNATNFLKYRNRHVFRADVQFSFAGFEFGFSQKYQSAFENIEYLRPLNKFL
jgi:iron complex outermembrane receptor protein